ncbi:MAG: metal-dependent transcriptional regulator [bacterium]|nr:metal-dependent transcriptional regulator [bacterium]
MSQNPQPSEKVENFLKAVYTLQQRGGAGDRVSTNTLSDMLSITAPSVTDMAQRLVAAGLIDYVKYHGVLLTAAGQAIALRVIRRHRLIELYLVNELNYALHEVHDEAERLEHAVSDQFVEAIARKLGNPGFDPHGDPIPTAEGAVAKRDLLPLSALAVGESAAVSQLGMEDADMLNFALERGFRLGAQVTVTARDPFDGPVTVTVDGVQRVIGGTLAATIYVER